MPTSNESVFGLTKHNISVVQERYSQYFSKRWIKDFCLIAIYYLILWKYNMHCFFTHYKQGMTAYEMSKTFTSKVVSLPFTILNLHYFTFYFFQFPWAEKYKDNNLPWPWQEKDVKFKKAFIGSIKTYIINTFGVFPPVFIFFMYCFPPDVNPENLPSIPKFVFQMVVMMLIQDFWFYWSHRALHLPIFYKRIHKHHHNHYNTYILSTVDTHWIEFIFGNIMPFLVGMAVMGKTLHVFTLNSLIITRNIGSSSGHSGYSFPWIPGQIYPFYTHPMYHNYHHLKNTGNYSGTFIHWDTIFKTNTEFMSEIEKMEKKNKMN